jgi:hypothetical protein
MVCQHSKRLKENKGVLQMKISVEVSMSTGQIDAKATTAEFTTALAALVAQRTTDLGSVADGVSAFFDDNKGERFPLPTVSNLVASNYLDATPQNLATTVALVADHIRANPSVYSIGKGRTAGGVGRIADLTDSK